MNLGLAPTANAILDKVLESKNLRTDGVKYQIIFLASAIVASSARSSTNIGWSWYRPEPGIANTENGARTTQYY